MPRLNEETGLKECSKCHEFKTVEMFHNDKSKKDFLASRCKLCYITVGKNKNFKPIEINEKLCTKCKLFKSVECFNFDKRISTGYNSVCKECTREYKKSLNYKVDDSIIHKECNACKLKLPIDKFGIVKRNKDGLNTICKDCSNLQHRTLSKSEHRRKYNRNKAKLSYNESKITMLHSRFVANIRNWLNRNTMTKNFKSEDILGCSFELFKHHIESQFTEEVYWENRSEWHLDHFIPVSCASDLESIAILNHYTNFRPLLAKRNLSKNNIIPTINEVMLFFKNYPDSPTYKFYLENLVDIDVN